MILIEKFIYAKELKKEYVAYGNFYRIKYNNNRVICCRNTLDIVGDGKNKEMPPSNSPDAIVIMMNPGNSYPIDKDYLILPISEDAILKGGSIGSNLVRTKPDITQYQIMRLMKLKKWRHVRVLNLSDYRNPKSKDFLKEIQKIERHDTHYIHSIFSICRKEELGKHFQNPEKPVIVAWGIDNNLNSLVGRAISQKVLQKRIGVNFGEGSMYYSHPSPYLKRKKITWLEDILRKLS